MANFYGTIDLLKLKGAKLVSGLDENHPKMNYVCIPVVNYSGVSLVEKRDKTGYMAQLPVNMWSVSDAYRQAAIRNRMSRGEDVSNYNPPSHQLEVGYSKEFRERAEEAARKRILTEHPDWKDAPEHEKELRNAVYNAVRIRIANMTASMKSQQPAQQQAYTPPVAAAANNAMDYVPPQYDANGNPLDENYEGDDLPF